MAVKFMDEPIRLVVHTDEPDRKAILASESGVRKQAVWIPRSQIQEIVYRNAHADGVIADVTMSEWIAREKGLI